MEAKKMRILEALQMQPLSEEEKASRHILGRLYGPIATTKEKTRNGRGYNKELWEKALSDEIFREKIANKSLFLELGHPLDREETDMEKVCACIPEMPKIVDGDLYAYVDILDTNNGRLLKTLCDYAEYTLEELGEPMLGREGHRGNSWVLLDFGSIVVHVFTEEARKFYDLERLWADAECVDINDIIIIEQ